MTHPFEGVIRAITANGVSSGAGDTYVNLRPAAGMRWEILWAVGAQDDGAVVHGWSWIDPDTTSVLMAVTAGGANAWIRFLASADYLMNNTVSAPILATYDRYPRYVFTASAASKTGYVRALVREYRGVAVEA